MDFYAFLLKEMGFKVSNTSYFWFMLIETEGFNGKMNFSETLIPYECKTDWIPELRDMLNT